MDRILFMDKGQIVEDGTYEELTALRGHFYEYCYLSMASIRIKNKYQLNYLL